MTQFTPKNNFFNQNFYVKAEQLVHYLNGFMPICEILRNTTIECGKVTSDTREYHNQLRNFFQNF